MRISKEPEVRKQEIIDAAMGVFAEKGYEATTMKDIAQAAHVVPGLCYHYFQNKHALYQTAVTKYARTCARPMAELLEDTRLPLADCLDQMEALTLAQEGNYPYQSFFNGQGNELFHKQLEFYMAEEVAPALERYLRCRMEAGEVRGYDPALLTRFVLGGMTEVMSAEHLPAADRTAFLRQCLALLLAP